MKKTLTYALNDSAEQQDKNRSHFEKSPGKDATTKANGRKAIEILSEKDLKISGLKQQLRELKSRNSGLMNYVKNQDSAVRKLGSIVGCRSSSQMSDVLDLSVDEDAIAFQNARTTEKKSEEKGVDGAESFSKIQLSAEIKVADDRKNEGKQRQEILEMMKETELLRKEKVERNGELGTKIRQLEDDIFARERAFGQISREKPINDEVLNLRLDQIREERDSLYDILKHFEKLMVRHASDSSCEPNAKPRPIKIDAAITIQEKGEVGPNREELLFHIEELRKCLEEIKEDKKRQCQGLNKKKNGAKSKEYEEIKAHIKELDKQSLAIEAKGRLNEHGNETQSPHDEVKETYWLGYGEEKDLKNQYQKKLLSDQKFSDSSLEDLRDEELLGRKDSNLMTQNFEKPVAEHDDLAKIFDKDAISGDKEEIATAKKDVKDQKNVIEENFNGQRFPDSLKQGDETTLFDNEEVQGQNRLNGEEHNKEDNLVGDMKAMKDEATLFARKLNNAAHEKNRAISERNAVTDELKEQRNKNEDLKQQVAFLQHLGRNDHSESKDGGQNKKVSAPDSDPIRKYEDELKKYQNILEMERKGEYAVDQSKVNKIKLPSIAEKPGVLSENYEKKDRGNEVAKVLSNRVQELEASNVEVYMKMENLRMQIGFLKNENKGLEEDNEELNIKISYLEEISRNKGDLLEKTENRNEEMENIVEEISRDKKELVEKVLGLEDKMEQLRKKKLDVETKFTDLEQELQMEKHLLSKEKVGKALVEEELKSMQSKGNETVKYIDELQGRIESFKEALKRVEIERNIAEDKEKLMRENLRVQQCRNSDLQRSNEEIRKRLTEENDNSASLKKKLQEEQDKRLKILDKYEDLESQYQNARNDIKEFERNARNSNAQIDVLKKDNKDLEESQNDLHSKLDRFVADQKLLEKKLNARNEELIEAQRKLGTSREQLNDVKRELVGKNEAVFQLQKDLRNSREENKGLKLQNERLDEDNKQALSESEREKETVKGLEKELDCVRSEYKDLIKAKQNVDLAFDIEAKKADNLKQSIDTKDAKICTLEVELDKLKMNIAQLNKNLETKENFAKDAESSLMTKEREFEKVCREFELLEIRHKEGLREFTGLQKQLENSWQEKDDINKKLEKSYRALEEASCKFDKVVAERNDKDINLERLKDCVIKKEEVIRDLRGKTDELNQEMNEKIKKIDKNGEEIKIINDRLSCEQTKNQNLKEGLKKAEENGVKKSLENEDLREVIAEAKKQQEQLFRENENKTRELTMLWASIEALKARHKMEIEERVGKWLMFEEYNKSLKAQLNNYKNREIKLRESGRQMKQEVGCITDELKKTKLILKDFQSTILDKDNDLKKIHDAVILLERSYAARQFDVQSKLNNINQEFKHLKNKNKELGEELERRNQEIGKLAAEKDEYVKKEMREENIRAKLTSVEEKLREKDEFICLKDDQLHVKNSEISRLKRNIAQEGNEVECLINKLEETLQDVKTQLEHVEREKEELRKEVEGSVHQRCALEESLKKLKEELSQKEHDLGLERSRKEDFQKELKQKVKFEGDERVRKLKEELFGLQREKEEIKQRLQKERDEEILMKTNERMENDNLKMQLKNAKEELKIIRDEKDLKSVQMKDKIRELERLSVKQEDRERKFAAKEIDYKNKLNDMGITVEKLERKISKAVQRAEIERNQREEVLAQLLESQSQSKRDSLIKSGYVLADFGKLESNKWRERTKALTQELESLQDQFSRYRSKNMVDREEVLSTVKSAKAEQILNLKKKLAETYKDKLAYQTRLNNLSSELDKMRDQKHRVQKDFDVISDEVRRLKKELLVQRSEIDWLRNALGTKDSMTY